MSDWLDQDDLRRLAEADPSLKSLNTILHGGADSPLSGRLQFLDVEDGLFCSINEWRSRRAYEDRVIVRDTLGIQFVQAGRVKQSLPGGKRYIHSGARVCLTTFPGEVRQRRQYPIGLDVKYVGVWIKPELLIDKYGLNPARLPEGLKNFFTGADHDPFCTSFPLSPRPWLALDEIFSNGFTGKLRETYLKGKMTELICETIGALGQHGEVGDDTPQPLSFKERMAIDTAALIYMQELGNPPSLQQLALRVGINRNKLGEGFQHHFGCSPHAYSKRLRMDWARRLLLDGQMAVQEVARAVGYSTQPAFSRAFADHFGFPPSQSSGSAGEPA